MTLIASRQPGNTLIWEGHFENLCAAGNALKLFETSPEHTELFEKQVNDFQDASVQFCEVLDYSVARTMHSGNQLRTLAERRTVLYLRSASVFEIRA
jgi:hypothetical protein